MYNKNKYKSDLDSLIKAYKLNDLEVITNVKDYIFGEYDLDIADNLDMQAQFETSHFMQAI